MRRLVPIALLVLALLATLFITPNLQPRLFSTGLLVPALLFTLLLGDTLLALRGAVVSGFVMDLFSALPFGSHLLAYVLTVAVTRWIFRTRITNRSLLAYLSLVGLGSLLAHLLLLISSHLGRLIDSRAISVALSGPWITFVVTDTFRTMILAILIYALVRLSGRRYVTLTAHEF